jgi:CRP/FNR family transcriptional regulator, anaerobic regulatory protein
MNTDIIKKTIGSIVELNEAEWLKFFEYTEIRILQKNEFLLKEGCVCGYVAFINYGSLIYFTLMENGKEITTDFAFTGEFVADNYSRLCKTASNLNIKALQDTELIIISDTNLSLLYDQIPKFERIGRILVEQAFIIIAQSSIDLQTLTASQRYIKLLEKYPDVFQKIPLYHIANFLGVAPKSLSRIRKEIAL